ncbi:MAG: GGDEF domain-containing protein [Eubacteriales bacterium]|nr:GGDEF domain-containing protein [Eubacteriales bacterium]
MISLVSAALVIFYIYSTFYIFMLNHHSYANYILWAININFIITSVANFMLYGTQSYEEAYFWMKIYRYAILPVPVLLLLGVMLLAFPILNKQFKKLLSIFASFIILFWIAESTVIGEESFRLIQLGKNFSWQIRTDTLSGFLYNLMFICFFLPSFVIVIWWLMNSYLTSLHKKMNIPLFVFFVSLVSASFVGIFQYFVIVKEGLFNGIFYFVLVGLPISLAYLLIFQERRLPLAMLNNYSQSIVDSLNEGTIIFDRKYNVVNFNDFTGRILGWEEDRVYNFAEYQECCLDKINLDGKPVSCFNQEGILITEKGKKINVSFTVTQINNQKTRAEEYLFVFIDVSKQKEMEERLTNANRRLNEQIIWRTNVIYDRNNALLQEINQKEENRQRIEFFLENDYMTELRNKNGFLNAVCFNRVIKERALISVIILNIKIIIETYSRMIGEKVIISIADYLKQNWGDVAVMARFENSRFLLYCEKEDSIKIANDLVEKFKEPIVVDDLAIDIDCGIGVVHESMPKKDINQLIIEAGLAAEQAKKFGGKQFYLYREEMDIRRSAEYAMLNDYLYSALKNNKLFLRYEIRFDKKGRPVGVIATINWEISETRLIEEREIMEIAEIYNFAQELEIWRMKQLISDLKYMKHQDNEFALPVMIQLMKSTFYNEKKLKELVGIIEQNHVPKELFEFALGEEIFMKVTAYINTCLATIRSHNIRVGLKNFGGMYSSLKYLRDLEIDFIVPASEFTKGIGSDKRDEAILRMILDLAKNMNYYILAQDIVSKNQLDFLIKDCHEFAGEFFCQVSTITDLAQSLENRKKLLTS